jgi:Tfp pilus assembly protein PilX
MCKKYICNGCDTFYDRTHTCDKTCALCTAVSPCTKDEYCATCNRTFLNKRCFQDHKTLNMRGKLVCQWKSICRKCRHTVTTDNKHVCFMRHCTNCNTKKPSGNQCYVPPLKPGKHSDKFVYAFFDTECTQDRDRGEGSFEHKPNLLCA